MKGGADSPVTFANSSTICSFVLLLGMEPTNSLLLATEIHTPMCLPGRISLLLHCKSMENSADKTKEQNATESTRWSLWRLVKIIFLTINIHVSILRIVYATLAWAYQFDSLLCSFFSAESDKGVASVQATERIHHQAQVPDGASFLKQRNQLILKKVSGDFAYKYLPG